MALLSRSSFGSKGKKDEFCPIIRSDWQCLGFSDGIEMHMCNAVHM